MIYETCEGKSYSEAHALAAAICKREPHATIIQSKKEQVSSMLGLKKETIHKITVAIPEYHHPLHLEDRPLRADIPKFEMPREPKENKLSALEREILNKQRQQIEAEAVNPRKVAERINHIAREVSLFSQDQAPVAPPKKKKSAPSLPFNSERSSSTQLEEILSLKSEVKELKKMMAAQTLPENLSAEIQKEQALPDEYEIFRQHLRWIEHYLSEREFSRYFIESFIKKIEKDLGVLTSKAALLSKAKEFLKEHIPVSAINLDNYAYGDTIAMVGPTGVGKTSTLSKFAAHFGYTRKKTLHFLSIDCYKISGESQLESYARFMNARFNSAPSQDKFKEAIAVKEADFTFIDTGGRSPSESTAIIELARWLEEADRPVDVHLVVSATTKNADLDAISLAYECTRYKHIIVTKLDETKTYGSVLSMAFKTQKPFSFVTDGQDIPQDFAVSDLNKMIAHSLD